MYDIAIYRRKLKQYMNDQVCSEILRHRHGFSDAGREPNRREGAMKEWALTTAFSLHYRE